MGKRPQAINMCGGNSLEVISYPGSIVIAMVIRLEGYSSRFKRIEDREKRFSQSYKRKSAGVCYSLCSIRI